MRELNSRQMHDTWQVCLCIQIYRPEAENVAGREYLPEAEQSMVYVVYGMRWSPWARQVKE